MREIVASELSEYLRRRIEALGMSPTALSEQLGWSPSYLTNLMSDQFRPSEKRCKALARVFGDDPALVLSLAGFYVSEDADEERTQDFARYKSLRPEHQRLVRLYMEFLKYVEDSDIDPAMN